MLVSRLARFGTVLTHRRVWLGLCWGTSREDIVNLAGLVGRRNWQRSREARRLRPTRCRVPPVHAKKVFPCVHVSHRGCCLRVPLPSPRWAYEPAIVTLVPTFPAPLATHRRSNARLRGSSLRCRRPKSSFGKPRPQPSALTVCANQGSTSPPQPRSRRSRRLPFPKRPSPSC